MEEHLGELFAGEEPLDAEEERSVTTAAKDQGDPPMIELYELPSADDETLMADNAARDDWISRNGRQRRK